MNHVIEINENSRNEHMKRMWDVTGEAMQVKPHKDVAASYCMMGNFQITLI